MIILTPSVSEVAGVSEDVVDKQSLFWYLEHQVVSQVLPSLQSASLLDWQAVPMIMYALPQKVRVTTLAYEYIPAAEHLGAWGIRVGISKVLVVHTH